MISIYCDESCHLEFDKKNYMVLGAISCNDYFKKQIYKDLREIKTKNGFSSWRELKWTGVSNAKINYYEEVLEYFINNANLTYRAIVVPKNKINVEKYDENSDYNTFYYKMFFGLLSPLIRQDDEYNIYLDEKDTCGYSKTQKLREVLCNNIYDFKKEVLKNIFLVKSTESELIQLADFLTGIVSFYNNEYSKEGRSESKIKLVDKFRESFGSALENGSKKNSEKVDIFMIKLKEN